MHQCSANPAPTSLLPAPNSAIGWILPAGESSTLQQSATTKSKSISFARTDEMRESMYMPYTPPLPPSHRRHLALAPLGALPTVIRSSRPTRPLSSEPDATHPPLPPPLQREEGDQGCIRHPPSRSETPQLRHHPTGQSSLPPVHQTQAGATAAMCPQQPAANWL